MPNSTLQPVNTLLLISTFIHYKINNGNNKCYLLTKKKKKLSFNFNCIYS